MSRPSLFLAIALLSCRGATPPPVAGDDAAQPLWPRDGTMPDLQVCGETHPLNFQRRPADVLILFDRSESMLAEFSTGTRYSVVSQLLGDLVDVYQDKLRFGFQAFPDADGCGGDHSSGCCAGPPSVPVAPASGADIRAAMAAAQPRGSTPTAEALRRAREYYAALDDGVADRYVLLATDGRPSCDATGRLAESDVLDANGVRQGGACHDAVAEVERLVAAGVQVIVLGVGSTLVDAPGGQPACLEEIARKGRGPMALPEERPWYYSGTDPEALEEALQRVFGNAIHLPCTLVLDAPPPDPRQVAVYLDGRQVPRNRNYGWDYVSPVDTRQVHFYGDYCRRIHRFQVSTIQVRYGCPPCATDPQNCE
jgi:hypothetical protein